jgi:serine phosphatase RsbU (regulator of sigma subunit)
VDSDVDEFVGEAPQFDDITMLCLYFVGAEEA